MSVMDGEHSAITANRRINPMRVSSPTETRQGILAITLAIPTALAIAATTVLAAAAVV